MQKNTVSILGLQALLLCIVLNSSQVLANEIQINYKDGISYVQCGVATLAQRSGVLEKKHHFESLTVLGFRELSRAGFLNTLVLYKEDATCPRVLATRQQLYQGEMEFDDQKQELILKEALVGYFYAPPFSYYHWVYQIKDGDIELIRRGCPKLVDLRSLFNLAYFESLDKTRSLQSAAFYTLAFEKLNQEKMPLDSQLRQEIALDWSLQLARSSQVKRAVQILEDLSKRDSSVAKRATAILQRLRDKSKSDSR